MARQAQTLRDRAKPGRDEHDDTGHDRTDDGTRRGLHSVRGMNRSY